MTSSYAAARFFQLLQNLHPPKKLLAAALILSVFETAASLIVPFFTGQLVDQLASASLSRFVIGLLGVAFLLQIVAGGVSFYLMRMAGESMTASLRKQLWQHLLSLPVSFYDQTEAGDTISRLTNDTNMIKQMITERLIGFITGLISIIGAVAILLYIDWRMTLLMMLSVPAALLILIPLGRMMYRISKATQNEMASFSALLTRVLIDIRLVKSYTASEAEFQNGQRGIDRLFRYGQKEARLQAIISPSMTFIMMGVLVVLIGYGGIRVASGALSAGDLTSVIIYMFQIVIPLSQMASFFTAFQKAAGATERIQALFRIKAEQTDGELIHRAQDSLLFAHVSFQYETEKAVLHDVTFKIPAGQTTAIVGPSGSGKTTLFSLLERFYEPSAGHILFGNKPIADFQLIHWRQRIGYVAQESPVMSGTIRDNLMYGIHRQVSEQEMKQAARQANAFSFIEDLPGQFDAKVGERGIKLSGGQKQRIAIARAMLRNPDILLLDEATSSLDSVSESLVQEALAALMKDRTTLVIAHRLSTIVHADQIIVMDQGKVTGIGTHYQLLQTHSVYQQLARQQDLQLKSTD